MKPFVTEYKGSARRNGAPSLDPMSFESERPSPRPFDIALRAEPEDSYDAAMRAADALFSIPSTPKPSKRENEPDEHTSQPYFDETQPDRSSPEKSGGRILRVIDEQPSPELALLEAERAPKRRGRKPGSKNKPKIQAVPLAAPEEFVPVPSVPVERARVVQPAAKAPVIEPAAPEPVNTSSRPKRFSWMRDKLKPGEEWKRRRLPPVCW